MPPHREDRDDETPVGQQPHGSGVALSLFLRPHLPVTLWRNDSYKP